MQVENQAEAAASVAPEKTVDLDKFNIESSKVVGFDNNPLAEEQEPKGEPANEEGGDPKETDEPKEVDDPKGESPEKEEPQKEEDPAPVSEEIDLREFRIEGEEKSVAELLEEHSKIKERISKIESDEFLKGFIDHYLATGDVQPYLEAKSVDWDKKNPVDVLFSKFKKENSDLDEKILEKKFKREFVGKYSIDPSEYASVKEKTDLTEDQELGLVDLERDAKKIREALKEDQKKFAIPQKQQAEPKQKTFDVNAWRQTVMKEESVNSLLKTKTIPVFGEYGYEIPNPESIVEMMVDERKFWNTLFDAKSKRVDFNKVQKVFAFSQDPEAYEQGLVQLGKNLGKEEYLKERKNTSDGNSKPSSAPKGSGDWRDDFLAEFRKQQK